MKINKWKANDAGFTLMEMIIVIAVLAVFIVVMTSLLIIPAKMSKAIVYESEGSNAFSLLQTHLNQSIRKNGSKDGVTVRNEAGYPNTLRIKTYENPPGASPKYLFYYYDKTHKTVYMEYSGNFTGNKAKSSIIAQQVERLVFDVAEKDLSITMDMLTDIEDKTVKKTEVTRIYLKAN